MENDAYKSYDLKVGYSCNNRCKHCVIAGNSEFLQKRGKKIDLSLEEIYSLIDEHCSKGINRIVLTGGEISIRKDFKDIIEKCKEKGVAISIQTNGRRFSSWKNVEILSDINDISLAIALHSSSAEIHDEITGVKGSYDETCQGIRNLTRAGISVCVKVVISKYNQNDLRNLVDLANELRVDSMNIAFPHALGAAEWNFDSVVPRYNSLKRELDIVGDRSKELNLWVDFETIPCCIIPKHVDRVSEIIYATEKTTCSPVGGKTFQWDEKRKEIKKKGEKCSVCKYNNICEGVWAEYFETFGDEELVPLLEEN